MEKLVRLSLILVTGLSLIGLQSCQKDELAGFSDENSLELKSNSMNTFYSPTITVGNGVARAWVAENKNGEPTSVGINLSAKALQNLPEEPTQYVLTLPKNKGQNFYTHVLFDWNPHGHEPAGIYDLPHFDVHFYIIPNEDRLAIPLLLPPGYDVAPGADYIPTSYFPLPGLVPEMGAHWANSKSPELPPVFATFTHTFIWGSYNGEFIFWEPMLTREYLLSQPNEIFSINQPVKYKRSGWYATDYKVSFSSHPNQYTVALMNLTYHDGE